MKRKTFIISLFLLLFAIPAMAVFEERDLSQTLSVLRFELKQEYDKLESHKDALQIEDQYVHDRIVAMIKKCEELSLMLYSQNQDYTFDMTYALKEVSKEYESFRKERLPYDDVVDQFEVEIERYTKLIESLQSLPAPGERRRPRNEADTLRRHRPDSLRSRLFAGDSLARQSRRQAFLLDAEGKADRDSCIVYAQALLSFFTDARTRFLEDYESYENVINRLKESYDYAQERYKLLQKKMFTQSQDTYLTVFRDPKYYFKMTWDELRTKYNRRLANDSSIKSEWRGPVVLGFIILVLLCLALATIFSTLIVRLLLVSVKRMQTDDFKRRKPLLMTLCGLLLFLIALSVVSLTVSSNFIVQAASILFAFCWLLVAVIASLLVRLEPSNLGHGFALYLPAILTGLTVITFRIMFIPNRTMVLVLPILLIVFFIWQAAACKKNVKRVELSDDITSCITLVVLFVTAVISLLGNVFTSLVVIIWWLFLLACIETLIALYRLYQRVKAKKLNVKLEVLRRPQLTKNTTKGDNIRSTWLLDLFEMVIIPVASVAALPVSILLALKVFDLQEIFANIYNTPFVNLHGTNGDEILKISISLLVVVTGMYFVFRYIAYFARSMYKDIKYRKIQEIEGKRHIRTNEVNLTLARNVIGMLVWGTYIVLIFILFKIPTGALSIVFAGLATGLGLAMKDILNNFIYGLQLMSGRLRVGDWVDCDGIRGKVIAISDQSTQIETLDGAVMSFLNSALFSKNFKNLTKNNPYEFVKIGVGVSYGTDVEKVREIILQAISALDMRDSYGRRVVDDKSGITVVFDDFGDNSVNLAVKQFVLVSQRNAYIALAKETIYNVLNDNGITIPFPQRDIHLIQDTPAK